MNAIIVTIGDEILIGQTIDTNSAWMGNQLSSLGINVSEIRSIKDSREAILETLAATEKSAANLVLITGGLGPTKDDITKHVLCEYFNTKLKRNREVLEKIEDFFSSRNRDILETNRQQADLPEACAVLLNDMGTASGMWFERSNTIFVSMPGVPYEMKHLMSDKVLPKIKNKFDLPSIFHKTIMTEGVGESFLVEIIKDWEESLINEDIKIAYLPSPGQVRIRLTSEGNNLEKIKTKVLRKTEKLKLLISENIFGEDDIFMEQALGNYLIENNKTISTAESCTGGYLSHLLTSISGSSAYYKGSIIAYSNDIKTRFLGVHSKDIEDHGAVSKIVVEQMAINAKRKFNTDYALATSGVAGPDGGTEDKPVGTVWIAFAFENEVISKKFHFEKNRERNIRRSALAAMSMLRRNV